jgi:hypothetical protein
MLPSSTAKNATDGVLANANHSSDLSLGETFCVEMKNLPDCFCGKYGVPYLFSFGRAALLKTVFDIMKICSKPKMRWVNASRVVAIVKNVPRIVEVTFKNSVGKTVGSEILPVASNDAISSFVSGFCPLPASLFNAVALLQLIRQKGARFFRQVHQQKLLIKERQSHYKIMEGFNK